MLKRKNQIILLLILLSFTPNLGAQEMMGALFNNYNGITSAQINPALMTGSRAYIDINIVGANAFFRNNWAYIPKEDMNIWNVISSDSLIPRYGKYRYNGYYKYYENTDTKDVVVSTRLMGPSGMIQVNDHAFGISTSFRSVTSGNNIPFELPIFIYEGLTYEALQDTIFNNYNFDIQSLSWIEIAASWAYDFNRGYKRKMTFGASIKLALPTAGVYNSNTNAEYIVFDPEHIQIFNYDSEFGVSLPVNYDSTDVYVQKPWLRGIGAGIDLGFVYTRLARSYPKRSQRRFCSKAYEDYLYRVGISILDLGWVNMNKNAQQHNFDNVNVDWQEFDTVQYHGINNSMEMLSEVFYGDKNASKTAEKISMGLPTAISIQIDTRPKKNFYLSAMWVQPIRFNKKQVRRPSQIAVMPRYEIGFFAASLPVSLLQYKYMRVGAAIRFGPLTIGTERLGILLGLVDLNGADIYFSLKFSLDKGICSTRHKSACYNRNF